MVERAKTWKSVVIWSVISAAFIGPGTVTTAVSAGASFKLGLLWAVTFATISCIILQEVAARITIASGLNVGQALKKKFGSRNGRSLQWLMGGSVMAGCAAYEAGNILGAVSGLGLITGIDNHWLTVIIVAMSFSLLWKGSPAWISSLMMILVLIMGIAFIRVAFTQQVFSLGDVAASAVIPGIPGGGELLLLGLIGTTIVPYNVFLGSGISKGQTVPMMRVGLSISVVIGGLITAAILVAGTAISDFSTFESLYVQFETKVGKESAVALALGLFAAGFSSAITSPYAASVIGRTVFEMKDEKKIRAVWIVILVMGFTVAISGLKPIPVILIVQVLNGLILPLLVIFLVLVVNDPGIVPASFRHGALYNILLLAVLGVVLMISLNNVDKALTAAFHLPSEGHLTFVLLSTLAAVVWTGYLVFRGPKRT